jgi:hypothetical protein
VLFGGNGVLGLGFTNDGGGGRGLMGFEPEGRMNGVERGGRDRVTTAKVTRKDGSVGKRL